MKRLTLIALLAAPYVATAATYENVHCWSFTSSTRHFSTNLFSADTEYEVRQSFARAVSALNIGSLDPNYIYCHSNLTEEQVQDRRRNMAGLIVVDVTAALAEIRAEAARSKAAREARKSSPQPAQPDRSKQTEQDRRAEAGRAKREQAEKASAEAFQKRAEWAQRQADAQVQAALGSALTPTTAAPTGRNRVQARPLEDSPRASDAAPRQELAPPTTDDHPNLCVSQPTPVQHKTCKGGQAVVVTNTCARKVDVRLCMMTPKGWDCVANWGLKPGQKWGSGWCRGNGQTFVDSRYSDAKTPLNQPPGM